MGGGISNQGLNISAAEFAHHIEESQVPHPTALHACLHGQPYWGGPLARLNNNLDRLSAETTRLLGETKITWPSPNPYKSIIARALEIHLALLEAIRMLEDYRCLGRA